MSSGLNAIPPISVSSVTVLAKPCTAVSNRRNSSIALGIRWGFAARRSRISGCSPRRIKIFPSVAITVSIPANMTILTRSTTSSTEVLIPSHSDARRSEIISCRGLAILSLTSCSIIAVNLFTSSMAAICSGEPGTA